MNKRTHFIIFILSCTLLTSILGIWQFKRYHYKLKQNMELENSFRAPREFDHSKLQENMAYHVAGYYDFSQQILVGPRSHNNEIGKFIYSVFYVDGRIPIIINRGFVADYNLNNIKQSGKSGNISLELFSKLEPRRSWFIANNIPEKDIWVNLNLEEVRSKLKVPILNLYFNELKGSVPLDGSAQIVFTRDYRFSNPHLRYIYFWFAMSLMLVAMLVIFLYKDKKR